MTDGATGSGQKAAIRASLLARRRERAGPPDDRDRRRTEAVLSLPELAGARTVAAYLALPGEPPTDGLLAALAQRGVRVLVPVLEAGAELTWVVYDGTEVPGRAGTRSPVGASAELSDADVVLVPAVAVDRLGNRLGRGGGSYDRALAGLATASDRPLVVALVHDEEIVETVPTAPHDQRVDVLVTEAGVWRCA